jgi:hypothetical protein
MRTGFGILMTGISFGLVASGSAGAEGQQMSGLAVLDRGQWELRPRTGPTERICVRDGLQLIQLRHPRQACERFVVADEPHDVTVQYTCRGRGYGRTHIRPETRRLAQIDTQGIVDGLPFNFEVEARWVGIRCSE